jgi:hypothetical protein
MAGADSFIVVSGLLFVGALLVLKRVYAFMNEFQQFLTGNLQVMGLHESLINFGDEQLAANFFAQRAVIGFEKAAAAGLSLHYAETFQFRIRFGDRVSIDAKFFGKRPNGREHFAGAQCSGSGGGFDLIDELKVDGFAGFVVDLKEHIGLLSYDSRTVDRNLSSEFFPGRTLPNELSTAALLRTDNQQSIARPQKMPSKTCLILASFAHYWGTFQLSIIRKLLILNALCLAKFLRYQISG